MSRARRIFGYRVTSSRNIAPGRRSSSPMSTKPSNGRRPGSTRWQGDYKTIAAELGAALAGVADSSRSYSRAAQTAARICSKVSMLRRSDSRIVGMVDDSDMKWQQIQSATARSVGPERRNSAVATAAQYCWKSEKMAFGRAVRLLMPVPRAIICSFVAKPKRL
ncbi:hypothetical protein RHECNPAF_1340088 [Rhizobium etli CNPAF512]|nr:hypothetical protein RHECNPAF_1340088 [Rhizobium etli CNPAF512]